MEESSPKTRSFTFYKKKAASMKWADLGMFRKAAKNVCTSTIAVPSDLLSPTPSTSSAMKTTENTKESPCDPEPIDE